MTKLEKLARHFAAGGCALGYKEVAAVLNISAHAGSRVITYLQARNGQHWNVTIERTPDRKITAMTPAQVKRSPSEIIRHELKTNPQASQLSNIELARRHGCSDTVVSRARKELGMKGPKHNKAGARPANKPRPAWHDEAPHLKRAAQFRQMWPARNQERAQ